MTFLPQNLPKFITFFSKNIEFDLDFDLKRDDSRFHDRDEFRC